MMFTSFLTVFIKPVYYSAIPMPHVAKKKKKKSFPNRLVSIDSLKQ